MIARVEWAGTARILAWVLLGTAFLFGGASNPVVISTLLVRIVAILALAMVYFSPRPTLHAAGRPWLIWAAIAMCALQLVPLPYALWTSLPGRGLEKDVVAILRDPRPWMPLTMHPPGTVNALLSFLPPLAMFEVARRTDRQWIARLVLAVIGIAILNALLGLTQVAQGENSILRFYAVTNRDSAVGLFANRNHSAILMVTALALLGWAAPRQRGKLLSGGRAAVAAIVALLLLIGVVSTASRAGMALALPVMAVTLVVFHAQIKLPLRQKLAVVGVIVVVTALLMLVFPASIDRLTQTSPAEDLRFRLLPDIQRLMWQMFPIGSGFGSFDLVYRAIERVETLRSTYLNHAHNDLLELVIEGGIGGIALLVGYLGWLSVRARDVIGRVRGGDDNARLATAALIAILAILAHSIVDYPLRTPAIATLFALLNVLLLPVPAPPPTRREARQIIDTDRAAA